MMNELLIQDNFNGLSVNIHIISGISVFQQDSGTGKTFLFKVIKAFSVIEGWACHYFDYQTKDLDEDMIIDICKTMDVVCFDSADLYFTPSLVESLKTLSCIVLASLKFLSDIDDSYFQYCYVRFDDKCLLVEYENEI